MNAVHLHLLLNHIPVLGSVFGSALLALALWRKAEDLKKVALGVFIISALATIPVYLTGEPAEEVAEKLPGVSHATIELHEDAAAIALTGVAVIGIAALGGLIRFRSSKPMATWFGPAVLMAGLAITVVMAWTANLGGQVRHSEIRSAGETQTSGDRNHED